MCGRYARRSDRQRIAEAFQLGELPEGFILPSGLQHRADHVSASHPIEPRGGSPTLGPSLPSRASPIMIVKPYALRPQSTAALKQCWRGARQATD
jgi:hypothetical protein